MRATSVILSNALPAGLAVALALACLAPAAGARAESVQPPTAAAGANGGTAAPAVPAELYDHWREMAGQAAERIRRTVERLGLKPPRGLDGPGGFLGDHIAALEASRAALADQSGEDAAKLESHQKSVLAFLDRATQINTKLVALGEVAPASEAAGTLRAEIEKLAETRFFGTLDTRLPAKLTATIEGEAREAVFWPQTIARLVVRVANPGEEPASGVTARLTPQGSVITALSMDKGTCASEGEGWRCTLDRLAPGEDWPIRVAFRHADPDPVGKGPPQDVRVGVALSAADQTTPAVDSSASFRVANCAVNYHASLQRIFAAEGEALLAALKDAQGGNPRLPGRRLVAPARGAEGEAARLAASAAAVARARGIDPWLATEADGRGVARVVYGLRTYLRQKQFPAMCTGASRMADAYRGFLAEFEKKRAAATEDAAAALDMARAAVDAAAAALGGGAGPEAAPGLDAGIARLAALLATPAATDGATLGSERGEPLYDRIAQLAGRREAIAGSDDAGARVDEAIAALETAYYLARSRDEYDKMAKAFDAAFGAIRQSHEADCGCRTGDYVIPPQDAAVTVPGPSVPKVGDRPGASRPADGAGSAGPRAAAPSRSAAPRRSTRPSTARRQDTRSRRTVIRRYLRRWEPGLGRYVLIPLD